MISGTGPIGILLGPVLGGVIVAYWSWRGVFLYQRPHKVRHFLLEREINPSIKAHRRAKAGSRRCGSYGIHVVAADVRHHGAWLW